jgi:5-formyltetrahydrofolate cyclo-ligase
VGSWCIRQTYSPRADKCVTGGFSILLLCTSGFDRKALCKAEVTTLNRRVQGQLCQRYSGNPSFTMPDTPSNKSALRSALRQRRNALTSDQQSDAAQAVSRFVLDLPHWADAQRVALYLASDGELGTSALANIARSQGKRLHLPKLTGERCLTFAHWKTDMTLSVNRYNIPEPSAEAEHCPAAELDIIFLPLVGWDRQGGRLGMGGGYYDRTLAGVHGPLLVGLAHACQEIGTIPRESWDILLDYVATDTGLYRCKVR